MRAVQEFDSKFLYFARERLDGHPTSLSCSDASQIEIGPDDLLSPERVDSIKKEVVRIVDVDLQHDIDNLVNTHMLRNRVELGEPRSLTLLLVGSVTT